ncbi:hypothetical protein FNV43_RR07952 [Rhamnella rubrinervis]|uniref:Uncharacterized protein n=1 Tax=Rhamnella rubrinervis TaxID=2594499 RepID=A0A8K0HG80_9ROSA|nr:hypothetical protein FNV43_RR07952 [Rhamnella rubrinervis]
MASVMKPSSRYSSYDSRSSTSSHFSDPASSTEFKQKPPHVTGHTSSSRTLIKSKHSDLAKLKSKPSDPNFTTMVKKFMENRSTATSSKTKVDNRVGLVIPSDVIAKDLKKTARNGSNFANLHRKLFGKGTTEKEKGKKEVKALTEVKGNTRTLAMVLRSERELLSLTKEQETEIAELKLMLDGKNREVEKLKDLCLKQREEIKALKNAVLFPDVMNSQLQEVLEKQSSELKQAKQLIPTLQRQVTSLTGQLQCIADDLAEVKADKYSARACFQHHDSSPRTPTCNHEDASDSLEFSTGDPTSPGSPDDMFLKDLNPCLTPYFAKSKSKEFQTMGNVSPDEENVSENEMEFGVNSCVRKLSKSSDCCQNSKTETKIPRAARRSDGTKCTFRK